MLVDRIFGKKLKGKYNFPVAIRRNSKNSEVSDQVKKLLTDEDQKLILMVRG